MNKSLVSTCVAVLALGAGCAKDRTLTDYQADQVAQQMAMAKEVAGTYTGSMTPQSSSGPSGMLTISIEPDILVGNSSDGLYQQQHAGMKGTVVIGGEATQVLHFTGGSFDYTNKTVFIPTSVTERDGRVDTIQLTGSFTSDGRFNGELQDESYPQTASTFSLSKNGGPSALVSDLRGSAGGLDPSGNLDLTYVGEANYESGCKRKIVMRVMDYDLTPDQGFSDLFVPVKDVDISFYIPDGEMLCGVNLPDGGDIKLQPFVAALWDQRDGSLKNSRQNSSSGTVGAITTGTQLLVCSDTDASSWGKVYSTVKNWHCTVRTDSAYGGSPVNFTADFVLQGRTGADNGNGNGKGKGKKK